MNNLEIIASSPLLEADPNSLDEFFNRLKNNQIKLMPREILNQDLRTRVQKLRDQRANFVKDQLLNVKVKKEPKLKRTELEF